METIGRKYFFIKVMKEQFTEVLSTCITRALQSIGFSKPHICQ